MTCHGCKYAKWPKGLGIGRCEFPKGKLPIMLHATVIPPIARDIRHECPVRREVEMEGFHGGAK